MTWVLLDDSFGDHPKVVAAGPHAAILQVRALCYANRHLTDGLVPAAILPTLTLDLEARDWPAHMIESALWEVAPGGWAIHDFLVYNASKRRVLALRKAKKDAGRKGAMSRWNKGRIAPAMPVASTSQCPTPTPTPTPTPIAPVEQELPTGSRPAPRKLGAQVNQPAKDSEVTAAIKFWAALFQERRGSEPVIAWPRACGQMVKIVRAVGLDETKRLLTAMFDDSSKFVADSDHGIGFFASSVNRWRGSNGQPELPATSNRRDDKEARIHEAGLEAGRMLRDMAAAKGAHTP